MQNLIKKIFLIIGVFTVVIPTSFYLINSGDKVYAKNIDSEYLGQAQYGPYIVGKFKINGEIVFCIDHDKPTPPSGTSYDPGEVYNNEQVRAILYYGAGGAKDEVGTSDTGIVATTIALDSIVNGNHSEGRNKIPGYKNLMEHAKAKDAPDDNFSLSKTNVKSTISGNVQKSQTIKLNADPKNSITLKVQSGTKLHVNGKTYNSGSVKITGGQSFYFTAPLEYDKNVNYNSIKSSLGEYQSILFLPNNSSYQRLSMLLVEDPAPINNLKINFEVRKKKITVEHRDKYNNELLETDTYKKTIGYQYSYSPKNKIKKHSNTYLPVNKNKKQGKLGNKDITLTFYYDLTRDITVNHIDDRDGRLIEKHEETKRRGNSYSFTPKKDLKKENYTYRPLSNKKQAGTVKGKDIEINFYYDVPLIKAGLKKIQVFTAKANEGLPVVVDLYKKDFYDSKVPDMDDKDKRITVALYQGDKKIGSKRYTANDLPTKIDFEVPTNVLEVDQKKEYTV
ncbi:thioester domain-containing protein, partial [Paraliobacillus ryukyuensis]|uniref:thioester domain-containing protein n=1 Tax=Paraliobacillus ryukyuensis TaxID=200904 RepID=UPI0015C41A04